VAGGS